MNETGTRAELELEVWATIENPDLTIEEAVKEYMEANPGNEILEIDTENRKFKVAYDKQPIILNNLI